MLAVMLRSDGTWKWNCCNSTASGTRTWKWGVSCNVQPLTFAPRNELASALLEVIHAMRGVITGRDVMQNVGIIYREFGVRCLARCLWVLAVGKRTTFLELVIDR